jgi:hypothetical protein
MVLWSRRKTPLLLTMDPSGNLVVSLPFLQYETSMTPNDVPQENHSAHLTQNYDTSQQPPGAEVASHTTFTFPGQAEPSLQNSLPQEHINLEGDASRMLTQFPVNFHGHEHEAGSYPPTPPSSDSSHSYVSHLRASIPGTFIFISQLGYSAETWPQATGTHRSQSPIRREIYTLITLLPTLALFLIQT